MGWDWSKPHEYTEKYKGWKYFNMRFLMLEF